jgi:hypothetical protein
MNPKLFISHASEDKEAFVRPLALALKSRFEIWYDEFSLKLGDSLRAKIDEGLRSCDFGIVVLSPAFFDKKWTQNELNGLIALEDVNRKIILPIWLDVTAAQVRDFSPMLADRVSVSARHGLERVVEEITVAVSISTRAHDVFDGSAGKKALAAALSAVTSRELDDNILRSEVGAGMYARAVKQIETLVWERLSGYNLEKTQRFIRPAKAMYFQVKGPLQVRLSLVSRQQYINSVKDAVLRAGVYLEPNDFVNRQEATMLSELTWMPTCVGETKIGFRRKAGAKVENETEVSDAIVAAYGEEIERRAKLLPVDE